MVDLLPPCLDAIICICSLVEEHVHTHIHIKKFLTFQRLLPLMSYLTLCILKFALLLRSNKVILLLLGEKVSKTMHLFFNSLLICFPLLKWTLIILNYCSFWIFDAEAVNSKTGLPGFPDSHCKQELGIWPVKKLLVINPKTEKNTTWVFFFSFFVSFNWEYKNDILRWSPNVCRKLSKVRAVPTELLNSAITGQL